MSSRSIRIFAPAAGVPSVFVTWPSMAEICAQAAPANSKKQNPYEMYPRDLASIAISSPAINVLIFSILRCAFRRTPINNWPVRKRKRLRHPADASIGYAEHVSLAIIDDSGVQGTLRQRRCEACKTTTGDSQTAERGFAARGARQLLPDIGGNHKLAR